MKILNYTDTTVTVREYGKTRTISRFALDTDPRGFVHATDRVTGKFYSEVGVRESPESECITEALRKARARGTL
jgi:hypothetical protein